MTNTAFKKLLDSNLRRSLQLSLSSTYLSGYSSSSLKCVMTKQYLNGRLRTFTAGRTQHNNFPHFVSQDQHYRYEEYKHQIDRLKKLHKNSAHNRCLLLLPLSNYTLAEWLPKIRKKKTIKRKIEKRIKTRGFTGQKIKSPKQEAALKTLNLLEQKKQKKNRGKALIIRIGKNG